MKLLLVIDMQNDFIDGVLGSKEAPLIIETIQNKINQYKKNNFPVVFTRDTHDKNYLQTQEGRNLPVEHCIKNTRGWEITSKLDTTGAFIFDKPSFGSIELGQYIKANYAHVEEIEVVGLCTDICVIANVMILKAALPEVVVTVERSCCAGVTSQSHNNALEAMKMCQVKLT
jgi:nicotinamidase-related amidase